MKRFIRDERGFTGPQIAAMIIAPMVAVAIAAAAISLIRTGTGLTEGFQRSASITVMANTLKTSVESASQIQASGDRAFRTVLDPANLPPGDIRTEVSAECISFEWALTEESGLDTLSVTRFEHESADCTSAKVGTGSTQKLTGIAPGATFQYENSGGRELIIQGESVTLADGTKPERMTDSRWNSASVATVSAAGTVQEAFGDKPLRLQASTWDATTVSGAPERPVDVVEYVLQPTANATVNLPVLRGYGTATWSDGLTQTANGGNVSRAVSAGQTYTVRFEGEFTDLSANQYDPFRGAVTAMTVWESNTGSMYGGYAFRGMTRLTDVPAEIPALTDAPYIFQDARALNDADISGWNVTAVQSMQGAFRNATAFNQSLASWETGSVKNMADMFWGAASFNQPLSTWNVAAVTDMGRMFMGTGFNQDISAWQVSEVTRMPSMFDGAFNFNQPLDGWQTGKVNDMSAMFRGARAFNQNLSSWNTGAVTNFNQMFDGASAFNGNIGTWDVSSATQMFGMFFYATSFNQPLSQWKTIKTTNMQWMFYGASSFDGDIADWEVSSVEKMGSMFYNAYSFNQPIGGWQTLNVTDMESMFQDASSFNQPLTSWNVSKVTSFDRFGDSSALSPENMPRFS